MSETRRSIGCLAVLFLFPIFGTSCAHRSAWTPARETAADRVVLWVADGAHDETGLGSCIEGVGDVNGDGVEDLLVGALPIGSHDRGWGIVLSGASGEVIHEIASENEWSRRTRFPSAVSALGDLNGDGVPDFALGDASRLWDGWPPSKTWIANGATGKTLLELHGSEDAHDGFGAAVSRAGDIDGDGVLDICVGSPWQVEGSVPGMDFVSGVDGRRLRHIDVPTRDRAYRAFTCLRPGNHDFDGDGTEDWLVGDPGSTDLPGRVLLVSGGKGGVIREFTGSGVVGDRFGASIASIPDLNDDGVPEVAVGAPSDGWDPEGKPKWELPESSGSLYVFSGRDGSLIWRVKGPGGCKGLGFALETVDDLDGDGSRELAVSAVGVWVSDPTSVRIYSLRKERQLASIVAPQYEIAGFPTFGFFGASLAALDDIDGDGVCELAIGAPELVEVDGGMADGRVWVISLGRLHF